jgi:hypothetical protein
MTDDLTPAQALMETLVNFATVSDQPNGKLIPFVSDYLRGHGVDHHVFPDPTGKAANSSRTIHWLRAR